MGESLLFNSWMKLQCASKDHLEYLNPVPAPKSKSACCKIYYMNNSSRICPVLMLHGYGNHRSIYPVPTGAVMELMACKISLN